MTYLRRAGNWKICTSCLAELPIVAVVGEDEPARAAELLAEATDVVTRPWSPPMLRSRVRADVIPMPW